MIEWETLQRLINHSLGEPVASLMWIINTATSIIDFDTWFVFVYIAHDTVDDAFCGADEDNVPIGIRLNKHRKKTARNFWRWCNTWQIKSRLICCYYIVYDWLSAAIDSNYLVKIVLSIRRHLIIFFNTLIGCE